jgi:hypothetical protein
MNGPKRDVRTKDKVILRRGTNFCPFFGTKISSKSIKSSQFQSEFYALS